MSSRLLLALSLLIVPLSGCIVGIGTMSAESGLSDARAHAVSLVDVDVEPMFMGAMSIEPFSNYLETDEESGYEFEVNTYADSVQGDGKVPGWAYGFCMGEQAVFVVMATGLGPIADVRDSQGCKPYPEYDYNPADYAITNWEIDSDEAADILNEHPDWPGATEATATFWILNQWSADYAPEGASETSDPYWEVEMESPDASYYAAVNARTGEVLYVEGGPYDMPDEFDFVEVAPAEESCIEGSIDDEDSGVIHALEGSSVSINLPGKGQVTIVVGAGLGASGVEFVLSGPDGEEIDSGSVTSGRSVIGHQVDDIGNYELHVSTETLTEADIRIEGIYCA